MTGNADIDSPCRLTEIPATHWDRYPSVICDREGNYCVAWYRYPPPETEIPCRIFFCKGSDRLDSIAARTPVQVTDDGRNHTGPALCQDGSGLYWLVWHCWPQREGPRFLLFSHSEDGHAWSRPIQPLPQTVEYMIYPSLVWHPSGRFWIAFSAGLGEQSRVYLSSSGDGKSWKTPIAAPAGIYGDDKSTVTVSATGELLMVWRFRKNGRHELRWSASSDGIRWQDAEEIFTGVEDAERPKLSVDNGGRVWLSFEGDGAIWICRLSQNRRWSAPLPVSSGPDVESRPSALIQNRRGDYWIAWTSRPRGMELWGGKVSLRSLSP